VPTRPLAGDKLDGGAMSYASEVRPVAWKGAPWLWVCVLGAATLVVALFFDGLRTMVEWWSTREEYSHGFVLPFVAGLLVWQKKHLLEALPFEGSWTGFVVVAAGIALYMAGELSALYIVVQYSFLIVLAGLVLALLGWQAFKTIWVPLLVLLFMIPLPNLIYRGLSEDAQLISSQIGVSVIRLFGISVFLEGNVIDLGSYKLQVAEACSGLRYLFPLMALGFIAAYLFRGAFWKRAIIFLSTIPITILMNSFRIGVIGVLVEHWGQSMAEGFLHDFEGWVIFMACTVVLVVEMSVLAKIGKQPRSLGDVFRLEFPPATATAAQLRPRSVPMAFLGAVLLLLIVTALSFALPGRVEASIQRKNFYQFPLTLDNWRGTAGKLNEVELDALKLDDYILADFVDANRRPVNFYVAYYASQRKGESAHSPRSCIPGDGWEITDLTLRKLDGLRVAGHTLRVNRVVIEKGENKQLVYYWFQQRGRVITNEYVVKWYLFWDALTRNRTDGALVRLVTYIGPGQSLQEADAQLRSFAASAAVPLENYIPD
jgi:exosortase D (VPLPA-CTERM-specific)